MKTVIIIRDESDEQPHAFDFHPARQRIYDSRTRGWLQELHRWLVDDLWLCLAQVPFRDEPRDSPSLPFHFSFEGGRDTSALWSPGPGHRRIIDNALEFGSPFYFPYSWVSPAGMRPANVRVQAEMRFTDRFDSCWIGVAVRSQGYMSECEHLAWLRSDGLIHRTGPGTEARSKDEHEVGQLSDFDPSSEEFIAFDICMDDTTWSIQIGDVHQDVALVELPHVFTSGRILLQTAGCRAALRKIRIEQV